VATTYYDPITGQPRKAGQLVPDTDLTGQYGAPSLYGAGPSGGGGISPTGASSYAGLLNIAGTRPDFMGVLNSDPLLQQARAGFGAESIADRAQLTQAQAQALIRFGLIPEGLQGDFATPETRTLAEKNTAEGLSTTARLNREYERVQQNLMDALAARGALRSGATGVALSDLQQERKIAGSDAQSQLMDYLEGLQRGFVAAERQRQMMLAQEQAAAAGRIDPSRLYGTPGTTARHVGNGLYVDAQGNYYDVNGNRTSPPSQPLPEPTPLGAPVNPDPRYVFSPGSGSAAVRAM
jgi:hypothetical protein